MRSDFIAALTSIAISQLISVPALSLELTNDCDNAQLGLHHKLLNELVESTIISNPTIRSEKLLFEESKKKYDAMISTLFPSLSFSAQPEQNVSESGSQTTYNEGSGYTKSNYSYKYNEAPNLSATVQLDIINLPKYSKIKHAWENQTAQQYSYLNSRSNIILSLVNRYLEFQGGSLVIDKQKEVLDLIISYTEKKKKLLEVGFDNLLDYNAQLSTYRSTQASYNYNVGKLKSVVEAIKKISYIELDDKDKIPLPSPKCMTRLPTRNELAREIEANYEPLAILKYQSSAASNLSNASKFKYLPSLAVGYQTTYYKNTGNLSGFSGHTGESYSNLVSSPYLLLEFDINLGGEEYNNSQAYKLQSKSLISKREDQYNTAIENLDNNLTSLRIQKENYQLYKSTERDSDYALKISESAFDSGFVDNSIFLDTQNYLFNSIANATLANIQAYKAYYSIMRMSGHFIDKLDELTVQKSTTQN